MKILYFLHVFLLLNFNIQAQENSAIDVVFLNDTLIAKKSDKIICQRIELKNVKSSDLILTYNSNLAFSGLHTELKVYCEPSIVYSGFFYIICDINGNMILPKLKHTRGLKYKMKDIPNELIIKKDSSLVTEIAIPIIYHQYFEGQKFIKLFFVMQKSLYSSNKICIESEFIPLKIE